MAEERAQRHLAAILAADVVGYSRFHKEANKAIAKNPYNGGVVGELGIWTFYSGDWERGKALIERARKIYMDDPGWLDFPGVLDHYRKGEYGEAKAAALATELRHGAVVQTVLAAAYGQLGELENAKRTIDEILEIYPEVTDNPRAPFLVRKMPTELIEAIMDGLRKAGFEVAPANELPPE